MSKGGKLLLILFALLALSWGVYECKYYSYYTDLNDRPWAYSRDENAPLLVGTWQGAFRSPDNIPKTIRLEILPPVSDEQRAKQAARRTRKRSRFSRTDKQHFDGFATVTSKLGKEAYELSGRVQTEDGHQLGVISFSTADDGSPLRNSFNIHSASEGGQWQNDRLTLTLTFSFITSTGSGYWSSADPRFSKKATVSFARVKP